MIIYCITNRMSGRRYIGMTVMRLPKRWENHRYAMRKGVKTALYDAMREYGEDAFMIEPIASLLPGFTRKELGKAEQEIILQEGTLVPNGYNLTAGGDGGCLHTPTKEQITKLITMNKDPEIRARKSRTMTGRKLSDEAKKKIGDFHRGRSREYTRTPEYRAMMSAIKKGTPNKYKNVPLPSAHKANVLAAISRRTQEQKDKFTRRGLEPWNKGSRQIAAEEV